MHRNDKLLLITLFTIIFFCGCLQTQDSQVKTIVMSAQQFSDDIESEINESNKYFTVNFKSLDEGDIVIINDTIDSIRYLNDFNITAIRFDWDSTPDESVAGIEFDFFGNLTNAYNENDAVTITFAIRHVQFSYEGWSFDCEVYEESWNQDRYVAGSHSQILPQTCISHAN